MRSLIGLRILIVEDEYLIANNIASYLSGLGAHILGPVPNIGRALDHTDEADAAVLDVYLQGDLVFPVADRLVQRGVPFVFFSGYERSVIPRRLRHVGRVQKSDSQSRIVETLFPERRAPDGESEDVVAMLPRLRLSARLLISDRDAADRLVERALEQALSDVDAHPDDCSTEEWLNALLRLMAETSGNQLH